MRRRTKLVLVILGIPFAAAAVASGFVDVWHEVPSSYPDPSIVLLGQPRSPEQHEAIYSAAGTVYELNLKQNGELLFLGTKHTQDPESEQVQRIVRSFEEFKPDIVFLESRMGLFVGTLPMGVRQFGEAGAVYGMSRNLSIPCYSFEPTREQEAAFLTQRFGKREVAFALFFRTYRSDGNPDDSEASRLLAKKQRQYGLEGALSDLDDADRCWREELQGEGDWRTAPKDAFYPIKEGTKLQQIAHAANLVRDDHLVRSLLTEVRKGKRVLAVAGMSHVINYEPVLRASTAPNASSDSPDNR
jgi:hypothetical protein